MIQIDSWEFIKGILSTMWTFWPVLAFVLAVLAIKLIFNKLELEFDNLKISRKFRKGEKWRSDRDLLYWLRGMNPSEFERYIADLFFRLGYNTQSVGKSHDGGVDVIAEKDGTKNYIQCKKFITSEVTVGAIRDFYGALADHLANGQGYFITTNKFTLEAKKFAEDKPIELIDGFRLIEYIRLAEKKNEDNGDRVKICPKCGGTLKERVGKYSKFYGCSNYPRCKYTESIK